MSPLFIDGVSATSTTTPGVGAFNRSPVPDPPADRVTLVPERGSALTMVLTADPDMSLPVGGWEDIELFNRAPSQYWKAPSRATMSLQLAIDTRLIGGPDMPRRLKVLEEMGTADGNREPPEVDVLGGYLFRAHPRTWVIQSITLGERVGTNGELVRQGVTIELKQASDVAGLKPSRLNRTRDNNGQRRRRTIRSRNGDTLRAVALRELGSVGAWDKLREWNKSLAKVDPDEQLKPGTRIVLN